MKYVCIYVCMYVCMYICMYVLWLSNIHPLRSSSTDGGGLSDILSNSVIILMTIGDNGLKLLSFE